MKWPSEEAMAARKTLIAMGRRSPEHPGRIFAMFEGAFAGRALDANQQDVRNAGTELGRTVAAEVLAQVHPSLTEDQIDKLALQASRKISAAALHLKAQGYSAKVVRSYRNATEAAYERSLSKREN